MQAKAQRLPPRLSKSCALLLTLFFHLYKCLFLFFIFIFYSSRGHLCCWPCSPICAACPFRGVLCGPSFLCDVFSQPSLATLHLGFPFPHHPYRPHLGPRVAFTAGSAVTHVTTQKRREELAQPAHSSAQQGSLNDRQ